MKLNNHTSYKLETYFGVARRTINFEDKTVGERQMRSFLLGN